MQHIEFIDRDHFQFRYHRLPPGGALSRYIDFFWETDFDEILSMQPQGFSDVLFANTGYTYLINLGTPYVMQVGDKKFEMKGDGYLPRHQAIECYHRTGNHLFGIKFRISPILLEKKINFSEYRDYIYPLSYLIEPAVISELKRAANFASRVAILSAYYSHKTEQSELENEPVKIVLEILTNSDENNDFPASVSEHASRYGISTRTLQRYFEFTTGGSPRQTLQIMRIRKATEMLANSPGNFDHTLFGYYDYSHFFKHLRQFLYKKTIRHKKPHLELLRHLHGNDIGHTQ